MEENLTEGLLFTGMDIPKTLEEAVNQAIVEMEESTGEKAPKEYLYATNSVIDLLRNILNSMSEDDNSIIVHCPNMSPKELCYDELVDLFPECVTYFKETN